jgi:hypothetical protein
MASYAEFVSQLISKLNVADEVELEQLVQDFEFQGFDPEKLYQAMAKKENDKELLLKDVRTLCVVLITRGTSLDKIKNRSAPAATLKLNSLIHKYGICRNGKGRGPEVVTLARIGATFPFFCASIANKVGIEPKVPEFRGMRPEGLFLPQIAGLVPKEEPLYDQLFMVLKHISVCFQHLIKPDSSKLDYDRNFGFMEVQRKSPLGSDADRIQWLLDLDVVVNNGGVMEFNFDPAPIIKANTYYKF